MKTREQTPTGFLLASASPARAKTLRAAGIDPVVAPSDIDEDLVLATGRKFATSRGETFPPEAQVNLLATAKAEASVVTGREFATTHHLSVPYVVLGCDSMLEFDGEMLGKPHDPAVAFRRIQQMRERDAVLWTGHHLILVGEDPTTGEIGPLAAASGAVSTVVHFGPMSDAEIRAYVDTGEPLEVAGSFTIDGLGGAFLRGVTGDPHSVVGVSLPLVRELAVKLGVFWPSLWNELPRNVGV